MRRVNPDLSTPSKNYFLVLVLTVCAACASDPFKNHQEHLDNSIQLFNREFESKVHSKSALVIHKDFRTEFLLKMVQVKNRVTFYESSILNIKFFKEGKPADTPEGPEKGFDEAHVVMQYRLSVLPSNRLKTIFVRHVWVREGDSWFLKPHLDDFLK